MSQAPEAPPADLLKDVESYDHDKMKHVDGKEKTPSQARDMTIAGKFSENNKSSKFSDPPGTMYRCNMFLL